MKFVYALVVISTLFQSGQVMSADLEQARAESVGMSSERLARIKPVMQAYVDNAQLAGVTTLIARRGKIVHFESVGKLNLATGSELKSDSLFRIYSMTKPVVAVALMQLYEQGKFRLNDPVSKFLPEFEHLKVSVNGEFVKPKREPTIRQLLSHTAGFTYGLFGNTEIDQQYREALFQGLGEAKAHDLEQMASMVAKLPLLYEPGQRWVYSISSDLVARLVEVLSGSPLDVYLHDNLFEPLGMVDTFYQVPVKKLARFGTNHQRDETGKLQIIDTPVSSRFANEVTLFSGGSGLVSTAQDYLRFSQMLLNGGELFGTRILSRKTVELMTTNQLQAGVKSGFGERPGVLGTVGFGLGFGVATEQPTAEPGSIGEYTWGGAAGTIFWIDPKEELIGILMTQLMLEPYDLRSRFKVLTYQAVDD